jgi:hypothetical protein
VGKKPPKKGFDLERIDKLLAQFPDEEPDSPTPKGLPAKSAAQPGQPEPSSGAQAQHPERLSTRYPPIGSWIRVAAGVVLALGITQWPYGRTCGLGLFLYLAAVVGVVVAGVWAGVHTWRSHMVVPHLLAQGVLLWGLALALFLVLPRVGYANAEAAWLCRAQAPAPPPVVSPAAVEPTSPRDAAPGDSATAGDSAIVVDSLTSLDSVVRGDSVTPSDSVPTVVPDTSSGAA